MIPLSPSRRAGHFLSLPKEKVRFDLSLYLVANRPSYPDENQFFAKVLSAVKGGVSCVQLRDHTNDLSETIKIARQLKTMLQGVPLFINTLRSFEVIHAADAEGIYLEDQFSYKEARKILGSKAIIGAPVLNMIDVERFKDSQDVDYISVKVAPSKKTCPRNDQLWGIEGLQTVRSIMPHRIVAIGGLNVSCIEPVFRTLRKGDGIAMAGGLMDQENPATTAQEIRFIQQKMEGKV